ncbi:hypothetical protein ACFQ3F_12745 [Nocardioides ginsengisoli]|uniref:Uncharacterized protein n=1 Tax=Nocardioides ginsengisoli TaxID=363868 RepID=A0ABW3W2G1_9ACTN
MAGKVAPWRAGRIAAQTLSLNAEAVAYVDRPVGRWNDRPMSAQQVKEWLQTATTVIVRPVIDLADHIPVTSYEIPDPPPRSGGAPRPQVGSSTATAEHVAAISTTPRPSGAVDRPARATWSRSADATTGPRPIHAGTTKS